MILPANYRIFEAPADCSDIEADGVEIGQYDSAFAAMEDMQREFLRRKNDPLNWYLLAPNKQVLLSPLDLYDINPD